MTPVQFPEVNVTYGEGQPEYLPLPVKHHRDQDGHVTSCWQLTDEELAEVIKTKQIYVTVLTFNNPLQPLMLTVECPNCEEAHS